MKKADPTAVGGFVVGAVALAVLAVAIFGSGRFFADRYTYVSFFDDSLMGLRVGAPVEFRGIQIGSVTDVWVQVDSDTLEFTQPVLYEIDEDRIREVGSTVSDENDIDELIEKGLRARLTPQSLVTGQQSIQLSMRPDTPVTVVESKLPHHQIPTIPSTMTVIGDSVDKVLDRGTEVLAQLTEVFSDENRELMHDTLSNLSDLTAKLDQMADEALGRIDDIDGLAETGNATLESYKALAERADGMIASNEGKIAQVIVGMQKTEKRIGVLTDELKKLIEENRKGLNDFSTTGLYEITNLAVDSQAAMEQFRRVMEEMERDPARFFFGRPSEVEVR